MKTRTLRQSVLFQATPHDVYETLMDSRKHARFSGLPVRISRAVGGSVRAYGGYIEGIHLERVADRKIVQSWSGSSWPVRHVSTVSFILSRVKGGTRLSFAQIGVPDRVPRGHPPGLEGHLLGADEVRPGSEGVAAEKRPPAG